MVGPLHQRQSGKSVRSNRWWQRLEQRNAKPDSLEQKWEVVHDGAGVRLTISAASKQVTSYSVPCSASHARSLTNMLGARALLLARPWPSTPHISTLSPFDSVRVEPGFRLGLFFSLTKLTPSDPGSNRLQPRIRISIFQLIWTKLAPIIGRPFICTPRVFTRIDPLVARVGARHRSEIVTHVIFLIFPYKF